jgi:hypothetical protein
MRILALVLKDSQQPSNKHTKASYFAAHNCRIYQVLSYKKRNKQAIKAFMRKNRKKNGNHKKKKHFPFSMYSFTQGYKQIQLLVNMTNNEVKGKNLDTILDYICHQTLPADKEEQNEMRNTALLIMETSTQILQYNHLITHDKLKIETLNTTKTNKKVLETEVKRLEELNVYHQNLKNLVTKTPFLSEYFQKNNITL